MWFIKKKEHHSILMEVLREEYDRLERQLVAYKRDLEEAEPGSSREKQLKESIARAKDDRKRLKRVLK